MKTVKMLGCLVLICAIVCGCVLLGRESGVAAAVKDEQEEEEKREEAKQPETPAPEENGSVTVAPVYSEGLRFRSNGDGTCALAGIGSCTSSCLLIPPTSPAGDTVVEILPFALQDSIVGAIEIPATVKVLSAASFAGCRRLSTIRVAAGNESFSEHGGVLYNAAGTTLVYCPAGLSSAELRLHTALRRIAAGAFAECHSLQTVAFKGTAAAWHGVIVGDENDPLYAASFRFIN
jgi:hypothetical protein